MKKHSALVEGYLKLADMFGNSKNHIYGIWEKSVQITGKTVFFLFIGKNTIYISTMYIVQ